MGEWDPGTESEELAGEFIRASFLHQLSSRSVKSLHTAGPSVPLEMNQKTGDHSHRLVLLVSSVQQGINGDKNNVPQRAK